MHATTLLLKIAAVTELLARHAAADPEPDFSPYYTSFSKMAEEEGLNVTRQEVHTEDGYWLTIHRVGNPLGIPVLLVHGLLASSDQWLILSRSESYPMVLADAGYDVWMANIRGNVYSRKHDTLSPDLNPEFWNFSLHEVAYYDLPAMVEHISHVTGHHKMFYSGYSVGGTLFLMMASSRPQYTQRFLGAFLLAPLVVRPETTTGVTSLLKMTTEFLFALINVLKDYQIREFFPRQLDMLRIKEEACKPSSRTFPFCVRIMQKPLGLMPSQYDKRKLQLLLKSFGSGTSTKLIEHVLQIFVGGRLRQFNYSPKTNLQVYGTLKPPEYDISRISCPVSLHYDKNDNLIDSKAVDLAAKQLPCVFCNCMADHAGFSHFGYVISHFARPYVFRKVVRSMRLLESGAADLRCT